MQRLWGKKKEADDYSAMPDQEKLKKEIETARKIAEATAKKAAEAKAKEEEREREKELKELNGCTEEELEAASQANTNWWKAHYKALPLEERVFLKLGRDGLMTDTAEIAKSQETILSQEARNAMNEQEKLVAQEARRIKETKKRLFIEGLVDAGLLPPTATAPKDQAIQEQEKELSPEASAGYRPM